MRINPNQFKKIMQLSFVENCLKINPTESDSIREFYQNESEVNFQSKWIRIDLNWIFNRNMNPNQFEHWFIRIENQSESGLILIHSDWIFTSDSFG